MRNIDAGLQAHLETGATTIARVWIVRRTDGVVMGFTDHDRELEVDGVTCEPSSGMDATSVERTTGLAVDNTGTMGALSSAGIRDMDVERGLYDGADVSHWIVNWQDTHQALLQFRGTLGEIHRGEGAFEAELRGLAEVLNHPVGRVYLRRCDRILGDNKCGVDPSATGFSAEAEVASFEGRKVVSLSGITDFAEGWFAHGSVTWLTGDNTDSMNLVRSDQLRDGSRVIEFWQETRLAIAVGDRLLLVAGCNKSAEACREKFDNILNYRGFPTMPGEDWSVAYPTSGSNMDGGSRGDT